ncbi:ATP-binding cassette sub- F member 3 [Desmophyllum pertusum]|uniref:ATP-binding cassette sub- F member 3 n=1 Tax=Desmophyllum pertusum TaxID=174260 RepID=A0A9W9Z734_9CNID|nr:ATP-binding cassette sub- F member 3 [Desmophyllum pertusum]
MADGLDTCRQILLDRFPSIDDDLFQYVADILESGSDDFESGEDIHDAVGSILAEVAGDEGEDDIIDICNQLMSALKGDGYNDTATDRGSHKLLQAPVNMSEMVENLEVEEDETSSIWIVRKESNTVVDQRKLQKLKPNLKQSRKNVHKMMNLIMRSKGGK